ncbi:S8/S53 family peptidase [uncultured Oscillibacter sp.]|uniref:S8/S53 family peptidase n=1 Tax=uncultured Oscillibacter sp. TaxID=876091 RepID=UPI002627D259|nr:S8/S53 family peptidase [uncultured Oscillibacter sp.]
MNKQTLTRCLAAFLAPVLLTACAPSRKEALTAGTISRRPPAAVSFWQADPEADHGFSDLRGADLMSMDLSDRETELLAAEFDTQTQWPAALPEDFDPERLIELGKDPGLGLRALHEQGITGRGVGIAIIDQTLLTEHQEYGDRLRFYQEYHSAAQDGASVHGPAVASIALGETVGAAPEALLYFIADDVGTGEGKNFVRDLSYYAGDVDRFIALNETLPEEEKIRVISMSVGWMPEDRGAEAMEAAIARARAAGIAVVCVNSQDPLLEPWMGMGRTPYGDPGRLEDCRPGAFWEEQLYSGEYRGADGSLLLVPMDRRTAASPAGPEEYAYFPEGGMSWAVPWVAGLYALACQVKPEVTFEEFLAAAQATAHPVSIWKDERTEYPCGKAVDPAALLERLGA